MMGKLQRRAQLNLPPNGHDLLILISITMTTRMKIQRGEVELESTGIIKRPIVQKKGNLSVKLKEFLVHIRDEHCFYLCRFFIIFYSHEDGVGSSKMYQGIKYVEV